MMCNSRRGTLDVRRHGMETKNYDFPGNTTSGEQDSLLRSVRVDGRGAAGSSRAVRGKLEVRTALCRVYPTSKLVLCDDVSGMRFALRAPGNRSILIRMLPLDELHTSNERAVEDPCVGKSCNRALEVDDSVRDIGDDAKHGERPSKIGRQRHFNMAAPMSSSGSKTGDSVCS